MARVRTWALGLTASLAALPSPGADVSRSARGLDPARLQPARILAPHEGECVAIAVHPGGVRAATGGLDGRIVEIDLRDGSVRGAFEGHDKGVASLDYSPDGRMLVSGGRDGTARLRHAHALGAVRSVIPGFSVTHMPVRFTPDGRRILYRKGSNVIGEWDLAEGAAAGDFVGHPRDLLCVAFHPDGRRMVSSDNGGRIIVWDLSSRRILRNLAHGQLTTSVAFSPDGRWLASSDWDQTVRVWSAADYSLRGVLSEAHSKVNWLSFAPDRRHLLTGSDSGRLRVYTLPDLALAREIATGDGIEIIAFSRNGRALLTGHTSGRVTIWDPR